MLFEWLNKERNSHLPYLFLIIIITLFGCLIKIKFSKKMRNLINNEIFRMMILSIIAYYSNNNINVCMLISVSFIMIMKLSIDNEREETFKKLEKFTEIYRN